MANPYCEHIRVEIQIDGVYCHILERDYGQCRGTQRKAIIQKKVDGDLVTPAQAVHNALSEVTDEQFITGNMECNAVTRRQQYNIAKEAKLKIATDQGLGND